MNLYKAILLSRCIVILKKSVVSIAWGIFRTEHTAQLKVNSIEIPKSYKPHKSMGSVMIKLLTVFKVAL